MFHDYVDTPYVGGNNADRNYCHDDVVLMMLMLIIIVMMVLESTLPLVFSRWMRRDSADGPIESHCKNTYKRMMDMA